MSIGERYDAVSGIPNQGLWRNIGADYKSVCVITKDQPTGPGGTSPTCFYEFEMEFCRRWWWISFSAYSVLERQPSRFPVKRMKASELDISEEKLIQAADEVLQIKDPEAVDGDPRSTRRRRAKFAEDLDILVPVPVPTPAPTPSTGGRCEDKLIKAIQFTDDFAQVTNSIDLKKALCPGFACWIPFVRDCRCGGFTAHGSGPDHLEITGGTYDLFGAFGQVSVWITTNMIVIYGFC